MSGDDKMLNTFVQEFRKEFMSLPPEQVAYPRSVNGVRKWTDNAASRKRQHAKYLKKIEATRIGTLDMDGSGADMKYGLFASGAPIHVKGAILYNHLIEKHKLSNKYSFINEGDKVKFLHLKEPNKYQSSAITFVTKLPKELDFHSIIDYDVQYEKSFVEPLKFITDKINWLIDKSYGTQGTLEDFF